MHINVLWYYFTVFARARSPSLETRMTPRVFRPTPPIRARRPFDLEFVKAIFVTVAALSIGLGVAVAVLIGTGGLR